jgi:pectate lyase
VVATYAGGSTAGASVNLNVVDTACANPAGGYEGFGRNTTGGVGQPVYHVTNLNDSGAGSLRDAVSQGNRCVVFDLGGTINLASYVPVSGANITIDGFTAPSPGITLRNYELLIHGGFGASNVVVRGLRSRDAFLAGFGGPDKGFEIIGTSNIVLDHVSVYGAGKDAFSVTDNAHDITIQWSIFAEGAPTSPTCPTCTSKGALIKYDTTRISVHHNLFINENDRQPMCGASDIATTNPSEVVCDVRNNLVWGYTWVGSTVRQYGTANVVNNYFYSQFLPSNPDAALYIRESGLTYASGNYSPTGINIDAMGTQTTPFAAIVPTATDAITAARQIVAQAGAQGSGFGLDAIDLARITQISPLP